MPNEYIYSPFSDSEGNLKTIYEIEFKDLNQLKEKQIEEGPYIEYKRELSSSVKNKIPNVITSFANERGGWFFIGIDENNIDTICLDIDDFELTINNILKSNTSPIPIIMTRFLESEEDKSKGILVIYIPEGDNPPYISKGKIYRRVGSGSSPIKEIDDRYYLDKLYEKSERNKKILSDFCKKEITIFNRSYNRMNFKSYDKGMCNIYLIPTYKFKVVKHVEDADADADFIKMVLDRSKEEQRYSFQGESYITFSLPFEKATFSNGSVIFRNSNILDNYQSTIAWEQFFDGSAKFHIPLNYFNKDQCVDKIKAFASNFSDSNVFYDFDFVDGKSLIAAMLGSISTYIHTMKSVNTAFDEFIIAIELEHVRRNVLYFDNETFFKELLKEKGLTFSDKEYFFLNKEFIPRKVINENAIDLFSYFYKVFNTFGLTLSEGVRLFLGDFGN